MDGVANLAAQQVQGSNVRFRPYNPKFVGLENWVKSDEVSRRSRNKYARLRSAKHTIEIDMEDLNANTRRSSRAGCADVTLNAADTTSQIQKLTVWRSMVILYC